MLGQTDERTPDSCIDPAAHTMRAVPVILSIYAVLSLPVAHGLAADETHSARQTAVDAHSWAAFQLLSLRPPRPRSFDASVISIIQHLTPVRRRQVLGNSLVCCPLVVVVVVVVAEMLKCRHQTRLETKCLRQTFGLCRSPGHFFSVSVFVSRVWARFTKHLITRVS